MIRIKGKAEARVLYAEVAEWKAPCFAAIVDASIAAKWFLEEDLSDAARRVLRRGNNLYAPDFLLLESEIKFKEG